MPFFVIQPSKWVVAAFCCWYLGWHALRLALGATVWKMWIVKLLVCLNLGALYKKPQLVYVDLKHPLWLLLLAQYWFGPVMLAWLLSSDGIALLLLLAIPNRTICKNTHDLRIRGTLKQPRCLKLIWGPLLWCAS